MATLMDTETGDCGTQTVAGDVAVSVVTRDRGPAGWWRLLRPMRVLVPDRALHGVLGVAADLPGGAQLCVAGTGPLLTAIVRAAYLPGPLRVQLTALELARAGERFGARPALPVLPLCAHPRAERGCACCFAGLVRRRLAIAGITWPEVDNDA
jgi:hypothetical protein